jgi:hypothetical protein
MLPSSSNTKYSGAMYGAVHVGLVGNNAWLILSGRRAERPKSARLAFPFLSTRTLF